MALRAMYKGFKKVLAPLIIKRPGELAIDQDALNAELNAVFFPRSEQKVLGAKNIGVHNTRALSGGSAQGYFCLSEENVGSSIVAKIEHDMTYHVTKKSGQGNRFRVVLFMDEPSTTHETTAKEIMNDNAATSCDFSTATYNYVVLTYQVGADITQDTAEAMISFDGGDYAPYAKTNQRLTADVATLTGSASDQKTAINAIITAATGAADFAAFKTAMGAITPVTRSIQVTPETREEITEPEEEPVKKTTRKKSTAKADTEKEGE